MTSRRGFLTGVAVTGLTILTRRVAHADPGQVGSWSPRRRLPHIAIHSVSLPGTHRVLHLATKGVPGNPAPGTYAWVLDPATGQVTPCHIPFVYDAMCGAGVLDDEGRLRVYGGIIASEKSAVFNPETLTWERGPDMSNRQGAYYASGARTGPIEGYPGGAIVVAFGRRAWMDVYDADDYATKELTRMPAVVNRVELAGASTVYPRLMPLPDGQLFLAGTERAMYRLDVAHPAWTFVANMRWGRRYEGCATSIGPSGYEFYLCGASPDSGVAAQTHAEVVDVRTGIVREVPPILIRWQHNTRVLADGTVLVVGGRAGVTPMTPQIYDPVRDLVTLMAPPLPRSLTDLTDQGPTTRAYHSVAELLDDGSVLSAGGVEGAKGFSYEVFSPPYLHRGPRPIATLVSGAGVGYGAPLTVQVSGPAVTRVTLLRPEHSSHGYNAGQRCYDLAFARVGSQVIAQTPVSNTDAPPGWYRLFCLADGVPSVASWIRLS